MNKRSNLTADTVLCTQLYERYKSRMFRTASELLCGLWDPEDAVHDAFVKLLRRPPRDLEAGSPAEWRYVRLTLERVCIDILRKQKTRSKQLPEAPAPEDLRMSELARCMEKLAPTDREVLLLRYHFGCTTAEIAAQLGRSEAAVRKLEQRAKVRLDKFCREAGIR